MLCSSPRRTPSDTTSSTALSNSSVVATVGLLPAAPPTSVQQGAAERSSALKSCAESQPYPEHHPCEQGEQARTLQRRDQGGSPAAGENHPCGGHGERGRD